MISIALSLNFSWQIKKILRGRRSNCFFTYSIEGNEYVMILTVPVCLCNWLNLVAQVEPTISLASLHLNAKPPLSVLYAIGLSQGVEKIKS